jgi:hypothetical protein
LRKKCPKCKRGKLRITYRFPRKEQEELSVIHIVGLRDREEEFHPMMWETIPRSDPKSRWVDFKYLGAKRKRGASQGLRPAVFARSELRRLFDAYCNITESESFP